MVFILQLPFHVPVSFPSVSPLLGISFLYNPHIGLAWVNIGSNIFILLCNSNNNSHHNNDRTSYNISIVNPQRNNNICWTRGTSHGVAMRSLVAACPRNSSGVCPIMSCTKHPESC